MSWPIIILEPTDEFALTLVRWSSEGICTRRREGFSCSAKAYSGLRIPKPNYEYDGFSWIVDRANAQTHVLDNSELWPERCAYCDEEFTENSQRAVHADRVFRDHLGNFHTMDSAPYGSAFYAKSDWWQHRLSRQYLEQHAGKRLPIAVKLPCHGPAGLWWSPDWVVSSEQKGGHGWEVSGELPDITVSPSIHIIGEYHGFIQQGMLTADVAGRIRPANPVSIKY